MFNDIAIMVFALIAIFTGKKWAIITATIWFIVTAIIGFSIGILLSGLMDPELTSDVAGGNADLLSNMELAGTVLMFFEILLIIIGWIRVVFTKKKTTPQNQ